MAVSSHRDHFFQTTASIEDNERKQRKAANTYGAPIKFPTKLLALEVNHGFDPDGNVVFVAEAGGSVTALKLTTNEKSPVGKPATAPLTSLAHSVGHPGLLTPFKPLYVFAGCWDKSVIKYSFGIAPHTDAAPSETGQTAFPAHRDFVKCIAVAPTADRQSVLVSGGADGELNFWTLDGARLATLRPNCRAIESITVDPLSAPDQPIIFFSTSQREIFQVILPSLAEFSSHNLQISSPLIVHETSVYKLHFDEDGDLWTASADKTAKHLSRDNGWAVDTVLPHPDFVKDITAHPETRIVATACRDEEVRIWNGSTGELLHVFSGHYEEVTGVAITGDLLLSVSIDATLRRWSIAPGDIQKEIEKTKQPDLLADNPEPNPDMGMLTEEEEAELRALMEEEEDETLEKMVVDQE